MMGKRSCFGSDTLGTGKLDIRESTAPKIQFLYGVALQLQIQKRIRVSSKGVNGVERGAPHGSVVPVIYPGALTPSKPAVIKMLRSVGKNSLRTEFSYHSD